MILADGWFRGQIGITRAADQWGDRLALLAAAAPASTTTASVTVVGTGPGWRSSTGHVVAADLIAGERWDLTRLPRGWDAPGFDDIGWDDVTVVEHGYAGLVDSPAPPVRRVEELVPVSVHPARRAPADRRPRPEHQRLGPAHRPRPGRHHAHAHPRRVARARTATSPPTTSGPRCRSCPSRCRPGRSTRWSPPACPGEVFEPRRTTHGFQYVRIEGHPGDLTPDDVRGVVVHTDLRRTGWFPCSDERLDRFHEAAVWSFRDNACDVPTDCPHRERAGWTGDWQLFVPTAAFLYDVAGFSTKWLRDVAADQWPDGTVANMSPSPRAEGREGPIAFLNGSAGWGDAAVIVPWELYRAYGDVAGPRRAVADDGRAGSTAPSGWPASSGTPTAPRAARSRRRTSSTCGTPASTGASGWNPARRSATSAPSWPRTRATSPRRTSRTAPG